MSLVACLDCGRQVSDQAPACPNCGRPIRLSSGDPAPPGPQQAVSAWRVKQTKSMGVGCLVQVLSLLLGVGLLFVFPLGTLVGLCVIVAGLAWGHQLSEGWYCNNCKNPLGSGDARLCPACHATLWTEAEAARYRARQGAGSD